VNGQQYFFDSCHGLGPLEAESGFSLSTLLINRNKALNPYITSQIGPETKEGEAGTKTAWCFRHKHTALDAL
jgi:hypothetical protein